MNDFNDYLSEIQNQLDSSSDDIRDAVISESLDNLKFKSRKEDRDKPRGNGNIDLAERTVDSYKRNVKKDDMSAPTKAAQQRFPEGQPLTKASIDNMKAVLRTLTGQRNGGDDGKCSPKAGTSGNTGTPVSNYAADVSSMSLEDYREHISNTFDLEEKNGLYANIHAKRKRGEAPAKPGDKNYPADDAFEKAAKTAKKEEVDLVSELESKLMELTDQSWQLVDKTTREVCLEHKVSLRELNSEFKERHGVYPDKWIAEHANVELCGWMPLNEVFILHHVGIVYDVMFTFKGSSTRMKFFWPNTKKPSKDQMSLAVNKFYPKARLLAYYPSRDQGNDFMVVIPPMTENYEIITEDEWVMMSEEACEAYQNICEHVGEPVSCIELNEDDNYEVMVESHETGEVQSIIFEKCGLWDNIADKRRKGVKKPSDKGSEGYPKEYVKEAAPLIGMAARALAPAAKTIAKDVAISGMKDVGDRAKKAIHNKVNPDKEKIDEAAWTKKEGQSEKGGLNEKGRKSYERANPGSDLKAPSKKVGNPRRASFCARMSGMKKKLTSSKTANDPDSRINKSLRAWNCWPK